MEIKNSFYNLAAKIDHILNRDDPSTDWISLQQLLKNRDIEQYFFCHVRSSKWLVLLKEKGYFKAQNNPIPIPSQDESYFTIPTWYVLAYLEKISQQISTDQVDQYSEYLLDIIRDVTKYHVENNRKFDNYHTWWYFVKILINIPNDRIVKYLKDNHIHMGKDWIREWITSRFNSMLPASDIATKLLPKFLTEDSEDMKIAEQIIEVITDIKEDYFQDEDVVQEIGSFEKKKEPRTKVDYYYLMESFKKNSDKIGEICSDSLIFNLANKIKKILAKEHSNYQVLIELEDNTYRISATHIKEFDFEFAFELLHKEEINSLVPEDKYFGLLKVGGDILVHFARNNIRDSESFIQILQEEINRNSSVSILKSFPGLDRKLKDLYSGLYNDYSYIWYKSLSAGPDVGIRDAKKLLVFILKGILLSKCRSNIKVGKYILDRLLSDEYQYPLFRRLVLLITGTYWGDYRDLFWKFIDVITAPFDESDYEVELYQLLQQNVVQFERGERDKIKGLISKGPRWFPDEKKGQYIAYWKQKWYSAMQKDGHFLKLFEEQKAITGEEKIEPPSTVSIEAQWGEGVSPLSKEDILKMNNVDLVKYLNEFKANDTWKGPTEGGLAEVLKAAVKENPNKFVEELYLFSDVKYRYVYNILYGLEDAWKDKKNFDWNKLFIFAKKYIEGTDFFEKDKEAQGRDRLVRHTWIINVIADLIQEGTRNDSWAFPEDYFIQAEEILDISIDKLPVEYKEESTSDAVTSALNSSYGRVVMAMILLALRKARVEDKKNIKREPRWNPSKYEGLFQKGVIEAFTFLGLYMPNFAYLNKKWVEKKIKAFETLETAGIKWQSFMEGYLSSHKVYQDLYKLMRNHYTRAIKADFLKGRPENILIQHITVGYLRGDESLHGKDSLFKKIIDKWEYSQINEIVDFFWSQARLLRDKIEQENVEDNRVKERIIKFWYWCYEQRDMIKIKLKDEYKRLFSDLSRLTVLLDKIYPENSQILLFSSPFVGEGINSSFFIEYLNKFEDQQSIKYITKIFLEMLSTQTPLYEHENIKSIVEKMYQNGYKKEADKICNIYGRRGYEFLRPLYEEHNKNRDRH